MKNNRRMRLLASVAFSASILLGATTTCIYAEDEKVVETEKTTSNESEKSTEEQKKPFTLVKMSCSNGVLTVKGADEVAYKANEDDYKIIKEDLRDFAHKKEVLGIKEVKIEGNLKLPEDSSDLFSFVGATIDFTDATIDTSQVKNMDALFACAGEVVGDYKSWNVENVESMDYIFLRVGSVKTTNEEESKENVVSIDLSDWKPKKLKSMKAGLVGATEVKIDPKSEDWQNVENVQYITDDEDVLNSLPKFSEKAKTSLPFEKKDEAEDEVKDFYIPSSYVPHVKEDVKEEKKVEVKDIKLAQPSVGSQFTFAKENYQFDGFETMNVSWFEQGQSSSLSEKDIMQEGKIYQVTLKLKPNVAIDEKVIEDLKAKILESDSRIESVKIVGKMLPGKPRGQQYDYLEVTITYKALASSKIVEAGDTSFLYVLAGLVVSLLTAGVCLKQLYKSKNFAS